MPEPFKNLFNTTVIRNMAKHFSVHWDQFDGEGFVGFAEEGLEGLELKERSARIMEAMVRYLPEDFGEAGKILLGSLGTALGDDLVGVADDDLGISGWGIMPMTHYVGLRGVGHFALSMELMKEMTKRFSSEFGIRFLILEYPEKTLAVLKTWTQDENRHVRRLVSEGTRPRLPWAMQLPQFIEDPSPVIALLECLKDDPDEYVRRSVANNLNDIAKDHPDLVADIAEDWLKGASSDRQRLVRHGCRTLIKNGHEKTLSVLGYKPAQLKDILLDILTPEVAFGSHLEFSFSLVSAATHDQPLMIDYVIYHQKANGSLTPKVFKWRDSVLKTNKSLRVTKKHGFKKITTRVYYPGLHRLEVVVNGVSVGCVDFQLSMTDC